MPVLATVISVRLPARDEIVLDRAACQLGVSKPEFIRRSIAAYAAKVVSADQTDAEIDARYIGQGGGLRRPQTVADARKRAVVECLREKHV
ncbi:MAG: ribbon-helix-helix protein, CopG family [Burkholderiaceae bacterium]|jgi:hypothetical protein|nr:ribbon-helix-helix protein, CopG family [Burkholderiaceae bacterium]